MALSKAVMFFFFSKFLKAAFFRLSLSGHHHYSLKTIALAVSLGVWVKRVTTVKPIHEPVSKVYRMRKRVNHRPRA